MQALVAAAAPVPLIKLAMRLVGLGFVVDGIPLIGTLVLDSRAIAIWCSVTSPLRLAPRILSLLRVYPMLYSFHFEILRALPIEADN